MSERELPERPNLPDKEECARAIAAYGVPPVEKLVRYTQEILAWNSVINLTGANTPEEFASKHIADVWFAFQAIGQPSKPVADIGSGCGIPGIPLAIMNPGLPVALVERRIKKAAVLDAIVKSLGLDKQISIQGKAFEELKPLPEEAEFWFRGFLPGPKLATYLTQQFPSADLSTLVLMKGPGWAKEREEILQTSGIAENWIERFAEANEVPYSLPKGLGERILVLV